MQYHWIVALIFSSTITTSLLSFPPLEGEPPRYRSSARYTHDLEIDDAWESPKENGHSDPYYLEGAVIDIEKMLENDPELRERYDALTKEERREFIETLSSFNEVFQQAFEALLPDDKADQK